jgi:hypothetical protein
MEEIPTTTPHAGLTKAEWRERQRNLSFAEKIAILEKMRQRDALIAKAGLRRAPQPIEAPAQPRTEAEPAEPERP